MQIVSRNTELRYPVYDIRFTKYLSQLIFKMTGKDIFKAESFENFCPIFTKKKMLLYSKSLGLQLCTEKVPLRGFFTFLFGLNSTVI